MYIYVLVLCSCCVVHLVCIVWVAVDFLYPHHPSGPSPLAHKSSLILFIFAISFLFLPPAFSPPLLSFFLSSPLLSFPLLSSYVDEIRWFLLGEASVHPSAAPSCACPTPSIQVINKPANSHSPSITAASFPLLLFSMCVPVLIQHPVNSLQAHTLTGPLCSPIYLLIKRRTVTECLDRDDWCFVGAHLCVRVTTK